MTCDAAWDVSTLIWPENDDATSLMLPVFHFGADPPFSLEGEICAVSVTRTDSLTSFETVKKSPPREDPDHLRTRRASASVLTVRKDNFLCIASGVLAASISRALGTPRKDNFLYIALPVFNFSRFNNPSSLLNSSGTSDFVLKMVKKTPLCDDGDDLRTGRASASFLTVPITLQTAGSMKRTLPFYCPRQCWQAEEPRAVFTIGTWSTGKSLAARTGSKKPPRPSVSVIDCCGKPSFSELGESNTLFCPSPLTNAIPVFHFGVSLRFSFSRTD